MDAFEKREEGFEKAFVFAQERRFKVLARRDKAIGLWAAEQLGLAGAEAAAYADALAASRVGVDDESGLVETLLTALASAKPDLSTHRIRRKIEQETERAAKDLAAGR